MQDSSTKTSGKAAKSGRLKFTAEEDEKLKLLVKKYGDRAWKAIAREMKTRTTRQCRERFKNYLSPDVRNGPWTPEEDRLLEEKYQEMGPKWSKIALYFNSRSDVNVKNRHALFIAKGLVPPPPPRPKVVESRPKEIPQPSASIFQDLTTWPALEMAVEEQSWDVTEQFNDASTFFAELASLW